jgi:hypothetical protein
MHSAVFELLLAHTYSLFSAIVYLVLKIKQCPNISGTDPSEQIFCNLSLSVKILRALEIYNLKIGYTIIGNHVTVLALLGS